MTCPSCGLEGVDGICSMCAGIMDYNGDPTYRLYMEEWQRQHEEEQQWLKLMEEEEAERLQKEEEDETAKD